MVFVEVRSPYFNEEEGRTDWRTLAFVRADGDQIDVHGNDTNVVDLTMPVLDIATGAELSAADSPERWARNLPHAYRAGDLVAVVVHDSEPPVLDDAADDEPELPSIPAPPLRATADDSATVA
jgi:hypothetical protein